MSEISRLEKSFLAVLGFASLFPPPGTWSAQAREWAISTGLVVGGDKLPDGSPNYMWADSMTREQLVTVLFRFAQMLGKA